jgi:mRNA interferase MazF
LAVKRGAIVVVAARGAYTGKPRPAVVVQSDLFSPTHGSITVCPITSDIIDAPLFRLTLLPGSRTGLRSVSQVMIDKIVSVPRAAITEEIGECDGRELEAVDGGLRRWLDLA